MFVLGLHLSPFCSGLNNPNFHVCFISLTFSCLCLCLGPYLSLLELMQWVEWLKLCALSRLSRGGQAAKTCGHPVLSSLGYHVAQCRQHNLTNTFNYQTGSKKCKRSERCRQVNQREIGWIISDPTIGHFEGLFKVEHGLKSPSKVVWSFWCFSNFHHLKVLQGMYGLMPYLHVQVLFTNTTCHQHIPRCTHLQIQSIPPQENIEPSST